MRRFESGSSLFKSLAAGTVLIATAVYSQVASPPPTYQFSSNRASIRIPAKVIANGLVFIQAQVNSHPGWFIVDNGTEGFVVDGEFARRNTLDASGSAATRQVGSDAGRAGIVRDVQISFPGLQLTHRNLVVIDLKALEPVIGHEVDGIVGSRLFDDFVVVVDYEDQRLSVYAPKQYQPSGSETALPVRVDQHGFQYIDATISLPGIAPVVGSFLIDGGANYYVNLYKPFSDAHDLPPSTMKLLDDTGTTDSRDGRAVRMEVGRFSVPNPPITFAQDTEGLMAAKDYAGLIGAEFLERFTVAFDNPGKRILLRPNRSYRNPAEYDESGLKIHAERPGFHKFVVARVVAKSPAAEAEIEPGDIIESVDHHLTGELTLTQLRSMLCRPNARYSIGIMRSGSHRRVTLQLRPLL